MSLFKVFLITVIIFLSKICNAQDTTIQVEHKYIKMPIVIIRAKLNVPTLVRYVINDTSFYKAFKNIKILQFTSLNDVKMLDKNDNIKASMNSKTVQERYNNCRKTKIIEETTTGDYYTKNKNCNYYTGEMFSSLLFAFDEKCDENNIVGTQGLTTKGTSGLEKHKQQLKMLFFNPGKKVKGIPFMGNKSAMYDDDMAQYYDYQIDYEDFLQTQCYKFTTKAKSDLTKSEKDNIVIDEMTTWFRTDNMQIMGRDYILSYSAFLYDFKVEMHVEMTNYKNLVVPSLIRYKGNWDVAFKKRERGIFTSTLFDYN